MTVRLVVVCTANVCRSPLAAAMLAAQVRQRGADAHIAVASAGVDARYGDPPAAASVAIARERGLDLDEHRSRPVDNDLDDEHGRTVLLTMTTGQRALLAAVDGSLATRCFSLRELARLVRGIERRGLPDTADDRVLEVVRRADALRADALRADSVRSGALRADARRAGDGRDEARGSSAATSTLAGPDDIADPYGRSDVHYRVMAAAAQQAVDALAPVLLGLR